MLATEDAARERPRSLEQLTATLAPYEADIRDARTPPEPAPMVKRS